MPYTDIAVTERKYNVILADPPWAYRTGTGKKWRGVAEHHYPVMSPKEIAALPVPRIADKDCTLFLWVTFPCLEQGLATMREWGFTYKTLGFNWVKRNKSGKGWFWGGGFWTRSNPEVCLIGVKGKPRRISAAVHSVIEAPVGPHSRKPPEVRDRIVQLMGDVPRIELFARQEVPGWDCWGNEVERQEAGPAC